MNTKNIRLIAVREYLTQVKKKQFIILTILAPLLLIGFSALIFFMIQANSSQTVIQVADESGIFSPHLKSDDAVKYDIVTSSTATATRTNLAEKDMVDGVLIIPQVQNGDWKKLENSTQLYVSDKLGFETKDKIVKDLSTVIKAQRSNALGIDAAQLQALNEDFNLKSTIVGDQTRDSDLDFGVKYALGMFLMYVTFMFILMYGVRVMRSVLEEKNNRVVEIIISSVKPFDLMIGKIIGVTFVALTQFAVWIIMSLIGITALNVGLAKYVSAEAATSAGSPSAELQAKLMEGSQILLNMNAPLVIFVFLFFFLFGYIFYSSMYAAIGSAVDNETETSQFSMFTIIPLMLGMYGSFSIIRNPDGPLGFWLSVVPFTSPVAMIARIPFGVPVWELLLSMFLLILSSVGMVWLAAKIYRIGILTYGNKASWKELWKWIRQ